MMNFGFGWVMMLLGLLFVVAFIGLAGLAITRGIAHVNGSLSLHGGQDPHSAASTTATADPIQLVRERYARGEIDHDEMERYLDNLLNTHKPRRD